MKTQSLRWMIGLGAAACSFASCSQPATECLAGLAQPFATVFTAMGAPSPAGCQMASPKVLQLGELVNFEWYHPPSADGASYDDDKSSVAIKTNSMGTELAVYNAGCPAPASCPAPLPCTFVPAGDGGAGSNGDGDCDPTGHLTDICKDATTGSACGASSAACTCAAATCAGKADCGAGGVCVDGSCKLSCGPAAGCLGPCTADADCAGAGQGYAGGATCVTGQCVASCGGCPTGQTCGGGGLPGLCGSGAACTPATCTALSANCGPTPDGCGGLLDCGTCAAPQTCGGAGTPNVCGTPVADPNAANTLYALGGFAQHYPDGNDMCQVTGLTSAAQTFATLPAGALPTDTVGYAWSNVNVYVTAAAQGTQFSADVKYTDNGCTATYHAVGVWPAVDCTAPVIDPNDPRQVNTIGVQPDNDMCNPCADPAVNRFTGSGISPDFPVKCAQIFPTTCANGVCKTADPFGRDPYYCVLQAASDPPQLNPHPPACNGCVPSTFGCASNADCCSGVCDAKICK